MLGWAVGNGFTSFSALSQKYKKLVSKKKKHFTLVTGSETSSGAEASEAL